MQRRTFLATTLAATFALTSVGPVAAAEKTIKVGVTAGVSAEVTEFVAKLAKKRGLNVKVVEFQDYIRPNAALNDGDLDANIYNTKPFLDRQNAERGYHLVIAAKAFTLPMAFYSHKIKNLKDIPDGATVGIPNDQAMGGRALLLLSNSGLITLREGSGLLASPLDVVKNPKHLKFVELEAAQLPRSLDDLTISAVNGNYAYTAGLNPKRDGLLVEAGDGPYVCHIVVQEKDKDAPWVKTFVEVYQQPEVKKFIEDKYKGSVLAGW